MRDTHRHGGHTSGRASPWDSGQRLLGFLSRRAQGSWRGTERRPQERRKRTSEPLVMLPVGSRLIKPFAADTLPSDTRRGGPRAQRAEGTTEGHAQAWTRKAVCLLGLEIVGSGWLPFLFISTIFEGNVSNHQYVPIPTLYFGSK